MDQTKAMVIASFQSNLNIELPPDLEFDYQVDKETGSPEFFSGDYTIRMNWSSENTPNHYSSLVSFQEDEDLLKGSGVIHQLIASIAYESGLFSGFEDQAIDAFDDELGIIVAEDYNMGVSLRYTQDYSVFNDNGTELTIYWEDRIAQPDEIHWDSPNEDAVEPNILTGYSASFDEVDLDNETGNIIGLSYHYDDLNNPTNGRAVQFPEFSQTIEQQNQMLDAAKAFLSSKGQTPGMMRIATPSNLGDAILFRFAASEGNLIDVITVTTTTDLKIVGYSLHR